jgi:hypothetical protein
VASALADGAPRGTTSHRIVTRFGHLSAVTTRYRRRTLPSPKQQLAWLRLALVAHLAEQGASGAWIARQLAYGSRPAFGRHLRLMLDVPAGVFCSHVEAERFWQDGVVPALRMDDPAWHAAAVLGGVRAAAGPHRSGAPAPPVSCDVRHP